MAPEMYWTPDLAHFFHLRPADMESLRPWQLLACHEALHKATKGR